MGKVDELNCDLTVERKRVSDADGTATRLESYVAELRADLDEQREHVLRAGVSEGAEVQLSRLCYDLKVQCECTEKWKAQSIQQEEMNFVQEGLHVEQVEKLKAQVDMLRTDLDVQRKLAKANKQATEEAVFRMGFAVPISSLALYGLIKVCGKRM